MAVYYGIVTLALVLAVSLPLNVAGSIQCVVCRGGQGSPCLLEPESELITLTCEKCAVFGRITKADNQLFDVQRDCFNRIFPNPIPTQYQNTCKDDNSHYIECTHTCGGDDFCSNNISYAPPGWNLDGSISGSAGLLSSNALIALSVLAVKFYF